jgi:hypothetical protein
MWGFSGQSLVQLEKFNVVLLTTSLAVSIFAQAVSLPEDFHSVEHNTLD